MDQRQTTHCEEQWRYSALAAHDEAQAIAAWAKRNAPRVNPRVHSGSRDLIRAFVIETTRPPATKSSSHPSTKESPVDIDLNLPAFVPELVPVSMIDVDRSPPMEMELPMSDACPRCGGHNMRVGDYVCWGACYRCYLDAGGVVI